MMYLKYAMDSSTNPNTFVSICVPKMQEFSINLHIN